MNRLEILSIEVRKLITKPFVITTWYRPALTHHFFFFILTYFKEIRC